MLMRTKDLTGPALDWAVAQIVHAGLRYKYGEPVFSPTTKRTYQTEGLQQIGVNYSPSTEWSQGGRLIAETNIALSPLPNGTWRAYAPEGTRLEIALGRQMETFNWTHKQEALTPLVAVCRVYVASRLGDEVDVPDELV